MSRNAPGTAVKFANIARVRSVVFGSGRVNPTGSRSYHFLHEATITMINAETGEQVMVATWSGAGVDQIEAAKKIGGRDRRHVAREVTAGPIPRTPDGVSAL